MSYRYLGNKTRLTDWITENVASLLKQGSSISDFMCGTASMSESFAKSGFKVLAGDILKFPTLHAKARLYDIESYNFTPIASSYESAVDVLNSSNLHAGFFTREYGESGIPKNGAKPRKYFTEENAKKIDGIRSQISNWRSEGLGRDECDLLLHDLILAVNSVANIAGTYGYYKAKFCSASSRKIKLVPSQRTVLEHHDHLVLSGNVNELAKSNLTDACYLDPPYTKRQYGGNYHILETIAQEDYPEPSGEGGLRNWKPVASDFCYKRKALNAFKETLESLEHVPLIFISYSDDGQVEKENLINLLGEYGKVELREKEIGRFKSNNGGGSKNALKEQLYIIRK